MGASVTIPLWLFALIVLFAAVTFASHFLFPSVRWFFRRRMEKAVAQLNTRLSRPIEPFKLLRRQDMIARLIYDPVVSQAIVDHANREGVREDVAFELARKYAKEIVPSFSAGLYFGIAIRAAKWLSTSLYRVRTVYRDEGLSHIDKDATVVFVMNHRSNMDYVLVTYLAAEQSALSYAVGEWAQVWPLSRLIRAMGAYFIRRRSRDDLYRKVLARYVQQATGAGVTQAVFPEGGLSLDGAIAKPKLGILKYIVDGAKASGRDVVFVPVALNYDRVLEDEVLIAAHKSGTRKFRARISLVALAALKQIWLRVTGKFHKFGYAAVSFGAPYRLSPEDDISPNALAETVMSRVAEVVPALSVPLVSRIVLEHKHVSRADIERHFTELLSLLGHNQGHVARNSRDYAVEVGLRALVERSVVQEAGEQYEINESRRHIAEFYANSVAHLF